MVRLCQLCRYSCSLRAAWFNFDCTMRSSLLLFAPNRKNRGVTEDNEQQPPINLHTFDTHYISSEPAAFCTPQSVTLLISSCFRCLSSSLVSLCYSFTILLRLPMSCSTSVISHEIDLKSWSCMLDDDLCTDNNLTQSSCSTLSATLVLLEH